MFIAIDNIIIRKFESPDIHALVNYLHHLSAETKSRFGPHSFIADDVLQFYTNNNVTGYIAIEPYNYSIIAYSVVKWGILEHDRSRLCNYHYPDIEINCCTYAPSVADSFQGKGIGKKVFAFMLKDCKLKSINRIILWGGVQCSNAKAMLYYKKLNFITLGQFEYNGLNQDMILEI